MGWAYENTINLVVEKLVVNTGPNAKTELDILREFIENPNATLKKAGFEYPKSFEETLRKVVNWTIRPENEKWLKI